MSFENLLIIGDESLGKVLSVVSEIEKTTDSKIIEIIFREFGGNALLMLSNKELESITSQNQNQLQEFLVIKSVHPLVLNSFYSIESACPEETLLTIEDLELAQSFELAQEALSFGLKIVELKTSRIGHRRSFIILTGNDQEVLSFSKQQKFPKQTLLREASKSVRQLFEGINL